MGISVMLSEARNDVLSRFVTRVHDLHGQSGTQHVALILDGLPSFLDNVVRSLAIADTTHGLAIPPDSAAEEHGEQRFDIGVNVVTMVREWTILRDVVLELLLERGCPPSLAEYQVLSRHLSAASIVSTTRYVELSEAAQQRLAAEHIGFIVHDLRNQVQGASAALELLQQSPEQREVAIECLADSIQGLRRVLDRELSRARLEALRLQVETSLGDLSLRELVQTVIREARPLALARNVTFDVECGDDATLHGDARLLQSALANIVGNAVKFTRPGTAIAIRIIALGDQCTIDVSDRCGGLTTEGRETLLIAHVNGNQPGRGYGLGLAIARESVQLHHGIIEITDHPGIGCQFRMVLPRSTGLRSEARPR